jgi:sarcosine oxidase
MAPGGPAPLLPGDAVYYKTRGAVAMPREWDVCRQDDCGVVLADPARAFLIAHAQALGARLHEKTKIAAPIASTTLAINGDARAFDAIIVAGGGWAGKLLPEFARKLVVRRRVLGWLKPKRPVPAPPVICIDNEVGLFGMPTPDGHYKVGMHVVGDRVDPDSVPAPDDTDAALIAAHADMHLPLYEAKPVRMARCLYTMTADENFLVTPSAGHDRVLMMSCCSGHGFKYAPMYGEIALDWLEGRQTPELDAFGLEKRTRPANGIGGGAPQ